MKQAVGASLMAGKGQQTANNQPKQQQSALPGRSEEASIRELVESCLVNDDFTPVLRLIFGGASSPVGADASATSPGSSPSRSDGPADAHSPAQPHHAPHGGGKVAQAARGGGAGPPPALASVQAALRAVASEQAGVVSEICGAHAMEIATCVAELDRCVAAAEEMRAAAAGASELQRSGSALASACRELHGLLGAGRHLAAGAGGLRALRLLLGRAGQVGALLAHRRLFAAWQLLERVKRQELALAMELLSSSSQAALELALMTAGGGGASGGGVGSAGVADVPEVEWAGAASGARSGPLLPARQQEAVARLRSFLQALVSDLEGAIEYYALAEFNNWLVGVRAESRQVGLRAIRQAAIARQAEEDCAAERRTAAAALLGTAARDTGAKGGGGGGGGGAGAAGALARGAAAVAASAFRLELAREGAPAPAAAAGPTSASVAGVSTGGGTAGRAARTRATTGGGGGGSGPGPPLDLASLHPGQPLQAIQALLSRHRSAAAAPLPPTATLFDATTPLLHGLDMRGLHRCVHLHRCLGRLPALRSYYLAQRRMQLGADLAPPAAFLEGYQAYLAQLTGFFVIEDAVRSAAPDLAAPAYGGGAGAGLGGAAGGGGGGSDPGSLLWEGAAGQLRGVLGRALEEALGGGAPAAIMLMIKDFMLLVCSALSVRGFNTAAITELLVSSCRRYHDLLTASVALRLGRALAGDGLAEGAAVATQAAAAELEGRLGLPAALEGQGGGSGRPSVPYTAPYSICVPAVLHAVRGFVTDSIAYLQGLLSPWELPPAVLAARDRLIAKTVVDALSDHTARLLAAEEAALAQTAALAAPGPGSSKHGGAGPGPAGPAHGSPWRAPRRLMRLVANAVCLAAAMQVLDDWTLLQVRPLGAMAAAAAAAATAGGSSGGAPPPSLLAAAAARGGAGRSVAAAALAVLPGGAVEAGLAGGGSGLVAGGSSAAVLAALRSVAEGAERGLLRLLGVRVEALVAGLRAMEWLPAGPLPGMPAPSPAVEELVELLRDAFDAAACILPRSSYLFLARAVVRGAGNAFMALMKEGVKAYNLFAVERLSADVGAVERCLAGLAVQVPGLAAEFAEPRQLCALLLAPRVEEVLIPEVRRRLYPSLELGSLVVVLERYREQARVGREKTGHVSRRTVEGVAKQLRGQMVAGTAVSGLRVLEDV